MPNQISTWLSQLAEVGVKWKVTFGCAANQSSFFLWVERLSRMTWISRWGGCSAVRSVIKARKSKRTLIYRDFQRMMQQAHTGATKDLTMPSRGSLIYETTKTNHI